VLPEFKADLQILLSLLLRARNVQRAKAWSIATTLTWALGRRPDLNPTEAWNTIKEAYQANLKAASPEQEGPARSFRRASGQAFELFVLYYLNSNPVLTKRGIRAVELAGDDFDALMHQLDLQLRPKDINIFLQGIQASGVPKIFGALFPKASYAERIRADEGASRALIGKGLWSATVTLDARNELGTEANPSVKRETINRGGFLACYSFNRQTNPGGRVFTIDIRAKGLGNPLIRDLVKAWAERKQ